MFMHHNRKSPAQQRKNKRTSFLQKLPLLFPHIKGQAVEKTKLALCKAYLFFKQSLPVSLKAVYTYSCYARQPLTRYTSHAYPGSVVVFQPEKISGDVQQDWSSIASGKTNMHNIPGAGHLTIIQEPYISALSGQLNVYLGQIQAKEESGQKL